MVDKENDKYRFFLPKTDVGSIFYYSKIFYYHKKNFYATDKSGKAIEVNGDRLITYLPNETTVWTNSKYIKNLVSSNYEINNLKKSIKKMEDRLNYNYYEGNITNTIPPHMMEDFIGDKIN